MARKIKTILKFCLLWFTAITSIVFITGLEFLMETERYGIAIIWLLSDLFLINICYEEISLREFYKLSGTKWIRKIIK